MKSKVGSITIDAFALQNGIGDVVLYDLEKQGYEIETRTTNLNNDYNSVMEIEVFSNSSVNKPYNYKEGSENEKI